MKSAPIDIVRLASVLAKVRSLRRECRSSAAGPLLYLATAAVPFTVDTGLCPFGSGGVADDCVWSNQKHDHDRLSPPFMAR